MVVYVATSRLVLRRFTPGDLDVLMALDNDADVMHFINNGATVERSEVADALDHWINAYDDAPGFGFWAADDKRTGEFVGWFHFRPSAHGSATEPELGYRLRREYWGRGLATEGARALIDKGFEELDIERVVADTMSVHGASRRVMEKAGLRLVRSFRADWPVHIPGDEHGDVEYALDRTEWEARRHASDRPPRPATSDDLDEVIELVIAQQTTGDRNVPSLGDTRVGVMAELDGLVPPWTETLRIVRGDDDEVVGAVLVDWDTETRRSWIHGPWIAVVDDRWTAIGAGLVDAATSQLPTVITSSVMTAVVEHRCMAELADRLGWSASEVNHVLIVDAHTVEAWPTLTVPAKLRPMTDEDVAAVRSLHDVEFPDTYYSAAELAARAARGDQIVLIADYDLGGRLGGYVAGQIKPDGDGYIDFLAVASSARRTGVGRSLVTVLCRQLIPKSTTRRVCLTVQTGRSPARGLYESLGFKPDVSIVGFEAPARRSDATRTSRHSPDPAARNRTVRTTPDEPAGS